MNKNTIILLSDEHAPSCSGYAGHPLVKTPHLDRLAQRGTVFRNAYCTSPICVPSRAGIATGRYPHDHGYWDNAFPYDGAVRGWGHELIDNGIDCVSIGKLHYRAGSDPVGLNRQINPMYVIDGVGDLVGLIRDGSVVRTGARKYYEEAGEGTSTYQQFDTRTTKIACDWLRERVEYKDANRGFTLLVSYVCPHFPLIAPADYLSLYPLEAIDPRPTTGPEQNWHPAIHEYARLMNFLPPLPEQQVKQSIAAYYALITFLDAQIGAVLDVIEETGLDESTTVIYTSDHGDNVGRDGIFGKSTMYEDSVGVPLIAVGSEFAAKASHDGAVSHVDLYQTILRNHDLEPTPPDLPGRSLQEQFSGLPRPYPVISEYHATCSIGGVTMLRSGRWKFVFYVGYRPQLFDLAADPDELVNLAEDPAHARRLAEFERELRKILDPEAVDARAKREQAERVADHGGRDRILTAGTLGYTPVPGEVPDRS